MINVENLTFRYPKTDRNALENMSVQVKQGEIFGFLGPSGAGKSTTLGILNGTLRGWTGSVQVAGADPSRAGGDFYRSIGVSFESPRFHEKFTALENLRLFGGLYGIPLRDSGRLLDALGLGDHSRKKVEDYSKGMKTRLSLARALLHDPDMLFLDEPTEGLDPALSAKIRELIKAERDRGKTVFLTTHDMTTAADLCDRVGFLSSGRLVLVDSPRNLALAHGRAVVSVEYRRNDELESADFPLTNLGANMAFQEVLSGGSVETIHSREADLAAVFLKATGQVLA